MTVYQSHVPASPGGALEPRAAYQPTGYFPGTTPAPAAAVRPASAFTRLDRLAPLALSTPALVLGRIWHAHGAAGSVGDAALLGALAAVTAGVGCVAASTGGVLPATALGLAGGLAAAAVAGYSASMWLPGVLWALTTTAAYAVAWRGWRADARREAELLHERGQLALSCSAAVQVETIRAYRDVALAQIGAARDVRVAELAGERERQFEARYGLGSSVPPIDPALLARRPETIAALAPPTLRVEQVFDYEAEAERR